jgi:hypothetical protein
LLSSGSAVFGSDTKFGWSVGCCDQNETDDWMRLGGLQVDVW